MLNSLFINIWFLVVLGNVCKPVQCDKVKQNQGSRPGFHLFNPALTTKRLVDATKKSLRPRVNRKRKCPSQCKCIAPWEVVCYDVTRETFPWNLHQNTTRLSIFDSNLDVLTPNMFRSLNHLTALYLSRCNITGAMEWAFRNMSSLESLGLSKNKFTKIRKTFPKWFAVDSNVFHTSSFNRSNNLRIVDLSYNNIKNPIEKGSFRAFRWIKELDLSYNNLTELENEFGELWGLLVLKLNENKLDKISSDSLKMAIKLRTLQIAKNAIRFISKSMFRHLVELEMLDLSENRIEMLELGSFDSLISLQILKLKDNRLARIAQETFQFCSRLLYLDLSNNSLETIEDNSFKSSIQLNKLLLSNNRLYNITGNLFKGLKDLTTLVLDRNRIQYVNKGAFEDLVKVKYLMLSNNKICSLSPYVFDTLVSALHISLRGNRLTHIESRWFLAPTLALDDLFLMDNYKFRFLSLEVRATALYKDLREIPTEYDFSFNPWNCDCSANDFLTWLHNQTALPMNRFRTMHCSSPYFRYGQRVSDIWPRKNLCQIDIMYYVPYIITFFILASVLYSFKNIFYFLYKDLCYNRAFKYKSTRRNTRRCPG